jgi:carbon storage regulator CsrA
MLKIPRCTDESIRIGEHIEVTILAIHDGWVQVGVKAPAGVAVEREERLIKSAAQWRAAKP